jgi:hypothetical protein
MKKDVKKILLKEIKDYFEHECRYNPTLIKERYGYKETRSVLDLVERLKFGI